MASSASDDGANMSEADGDFMALLAAVSLYVDELLYQPTFHLVMVLPIEV
jgi:hypothetical protein